MTLSEPYCEVAERCGGCPQLARTLVEQRAQKAARLVRALAALQIVSPPVHWLTGASEGYRNRIRLELLDGTPVFFNREKSKHCLVLQPEVRALLERFTQWAGTQRAWLRQFRVAELRAPDRDGIAGLYLRRDTLPRHLTARDVKFGARGSGVAPAPDFSGVALGWEGGPVPRQRFVIWRENYVLVPVSAFMQVHTPANRLMIEQLIGWANELGWETFVDLYAGSGNFTLPLVASGRTGRAIEIDENAVPALRQALAEQGLRGCDTQSGDAAQFAQTLAQSGQRVDLVVADPPRAGLRGQVDALKQLALRAVVLVSCRVDRFAHDAAALVDQGLVLHDVRLIDMFPHTDHVEVMALFVVC